MKKKREKWIKRYGEEKVTEVLPHEYRIYSGFMHPYLPGLLPDGRLERFYWGLVPQYEESLAIKYNTLNAKLEELQKKPAYRNYIGNRCIVLADAFMEYHWLDPNNQKSKKVKYRVEDANDDILGFAAIYSPWKDKGTGEIIKTVSLLTTDANELMGKVHNSAMRMPVILEQDEYTGFLDGAPMEEFGDREKVQLKAMEIEEPSRLL